MKQGATKTKIKILLYRFFQTTLTGGKMKLRSGSFTLQGLRNKHGKILTCFDHRLPKYFSMYKFYCKYLRHLDSLHKS